MESYLSIPKAPVGLRVEVRHADTLLHGTVFGGRGLAKRRTLLGPKCKVVGGGGQHADCAVPSGPRSTTYSECRSCIRPPNAISVD